MAPLQPRYRKAIILVLIAYVLGLGWGQIRLPVAAVKSLFDYASLEKFDTVFATLEDARMSGIQKRHLFRSLNVVPGKGPPRIEVNVQWNALVVARVQSGLSTSMDSGERLDGVYLCVFGAWVKVYSVSHMFT